MAPFPAETKLWEARNDRLRRVNSIDHRPDQIRPFATLHLSAVMTADHYFPAGPPKSSTPSRA